MEEKFFNEQFLCGNVNVGGVFSQNPTALIGSIFYMRHKIVKDPSKGIFDEDKAKKLISSANNLAKKLGVALMLDVVGDTSIALINYCKFIKENFELPILINSTSPEVRMETLVELSKEGLLDNIVYNSINAFSTEDEFDLLSKIPIQYAIVQAYNPGSKKEDAPLRALLGTSRKTGLLIRAKECGISNIMIDIPTFDMYSIGVIQKSAEIIKRELNIPIGTSASNATYSNSWLRDHSNLTTDQFHVVDATVNCILAGCGFNFLLFGPLEGYQWVMPSCAAANALDAYNLRKNGLKANDTNHPIYKIL